MLDFGNQSWRVPDAAAKLGRNISEFQLNLRGFRASSNSFSGLVVSSSSVCHEFATSSSERKQCARDAASTGREWRTNSGSWSVERRVGQDLRPHQVVRAARPDGRLVRYVVAACLAVFGEWGIVFQRPASSQGSPTTNGRQGGGLQAVDPIRPGQGLTSSQDEDSGVVQDGRMWPPDAGTSGVETGMLGTCGAQIATEGGMPTAWRNTS